MERDGMPLKYQENLASFYQKHIELKVAPLPWSTVSQVIQ
jgi:hypothetical protein